MEQKKLISTYGVLNKLMEIAVKNPQGFTVDKNMLEPITKGYAVGLIETQNNFGVDGAANVIDFVFKHKFVDAYGGWLNPKDNKYYFDAVIIVDDLQLAAKLGEMNKQKAIFDIDTGETIYLSKKDKEEAVNGGN